MAVLITAVLACTSTGVWAGQDAAPTGVSDSSEQQAMSQKIAQLEALMKAQQSKIKNLTGQVEDLQSRSTESARIAEVRKVVHELLADSNFRESLYPDVQQVGYDNGFYIKSSDEKFLLKISGYGHIRWTGQNRQTDNPRRQGSQPQDDINGFEIEEIFLIFSGHIHDPKLTYKIVAITDTDAANNISTYNAYINYALAKEFQVTAGLVKLPFGRQWLNSKSSLQFVDRSAATYAFNVDRSIAVAAHGTIAEKLTYIMGVANGAANANDSPSQDELDTNFAYAARTVAHILGKPIFTENDVAFTKDPSLEVGMSFAYLDDNGDVNPGAWYSIPDRIRYGRGIGGNGGADLTGSDVLQMGADAAFRYRGFSATAEYFMRIVDSDTRFSAWELGTGRRDSIHLQGGYFQLGYFVIPKKLEVAGRMGGVWDNGNDNVWDWTLGVNYYPYESYNFVIQADYTRMAEAPTTVTGANWSQNDEIDMFRVQLQFKF